MNHTDEGEVREVAVHVETLRVHVTELAHSVTTIERDAVALKTAWRTLRRAWESYFPNEPETWARFASEAIGSDAAFLDKIVEALDALAAGRPS